MTVDSVTPLLRRHRSGHRRQEGTSEIDDRSRIACQSPCSPVSWERKVLAKLLYTASVSECEQQPSLLGAQSTGWPKAYVRRVVQRHPLSPFTVQKPSDHHRVRRPYKALGFSHAATPPNPTTPRLRLEP
jgi:hypothetical protein